MRRKLIHSWTNEELGDLYRIYQTDDGYIQMRKVESGHNWTECFYADEAEMARLVGELKSAHRRIKVLEKQAKDARRVSRIFRSAWQKAEAKIEEMKKAWEVVEK